jgi:ATP/maltotriose-dependent transcriptional regulator MalT
LIRAYGFDLSTASLFFLGIVDLLLGWPGRGIQLEQRTIERARSNSHPYSQATGLVTASIQRWLRGDPGATSEIVIPARQICHEYGFHEFAGIAKQAHASIHFQQGEQALAIAEMTEAIRDLDALGSFIWLSLQFMLLAEMQLESGEILAAETLIKDALESLNLRNTCWCEPEIYRIAARVMLKKPDRDPVAAEGYLRRAIEIARAQGARWWELRATASLARLLALQGRRDEAHAILAEIYNWFTEGFDLPDLKEAKALLDELDDLDNTALK